MGAGGRYDGAMIIHGGEEFGIQACEEVECRVAERDEPMWSESTRSGVATTGNRWSNVDATGTASSE